jgi:hypothetical protein
VRQPSVGRETAATKLWPGVADTARKLDQEVGACQYQGDLQLVLKVSCRQQLPAVRAELRYGGRDTDKSRWFYRLHCV